MKEISVNFFEFYAPFSGTTWRQLSIFSSLSAAYQTLLLAWLVLHWNSLSQITHRRMGKAMRNQNLYHLVYHLHLYLLLHQALLPSVMDSSHLVLLSQPFLSWIQVIPQRMFSLTVQVRLPIPQAFQLLLVVVCLVLLQHLQYQLNLLSNLGPLKFHQWCQSF